MPIEYERDITLTGVANSKVDVFSQNAEADIADVPVDTVRVITELLLYGTAGNTTGSGIEIYEGIIRKWFSNDYKETTSANFQEKKDTPMIGFSPGSRIKVYIQSGATAASGRARLKVSDYKTNELR